MTPAELADEAIVMLTELENAGCTIQPEPVYGYLILGPVDLDPDLVLRLPTSTDAITAVVAAEHVVRNAGSTGEHEDRDPRATATRGATPTDIATRLGLPRERVKKTCQRLSNDGLLTGDTEGRYRLAGGDTPTNTGDTSPRVRTTERDAWADPPRSPRFIERITDGY